jgi:hypothetical protein
MLPQYFAGIGAQRTGTTWLANYFSNHPQVAFSAIKELHYFDAVYRPDLCSAYNTDIFPLQMQEFKEKLNRGKLSPEESNQYHCLQYRIRMIEDQQQYPNYFKSIIQPAHRVFGEITPSYSMLDKEGFQAILKLFPDAKFILILRNPADRYWSHLNLHQSRFAHFTASEQVFKCLTLPQYFLRTNYKNTLNTISDLIAESNLLVLFFEHLFDPATLEQELRNITTFLGIDYIEPDTKPLNETKKNPLPVQYRKRIFQHFQFVYQFICQNYPEQIPQSWLDDLRTFEE